MAVGVRAEMTTKPVKPRRSACFLWLPRSERFLVVGLFVKWFGRTVIMMMIVVVRERVTVAGRIIARQRVMRATETKPSKETIRFRMTSTSVVVFVFVEVRVFVAVFPHQIFICIIILVFAKRFFVRIHARTMKTVLHLHIIILHFFFLLGFVVATTGAAEASARGIVALPMILRDPQQEARRRCLVVAQQHLATSIVLLLVLLFVVIFLHSLQKFFLPLDGQSVLVVISASEMSQPFRSIAVEGGRGTWKTSSTHPDLKKLLMNAIP